MTKHKKDFHNLNLRLLFDKNDNNQLKDTYYDSLNFIDKYRMIKKNSKYKYSDQYYDNTSFTDYVFFYVNILICLVFFIAYIICAYLTLVHGEFAKAYFLQYPGHIFITSLMIFLIINLFIDDQENEINFLIFTSSFMCLGLNFLIAFLLKIIINIFVNAYKAQYSVEFKELIDLSQENFINYMHQYMYSQDDKIYFLHERINDVKINNVDLSSNDITFFKNYFSHSQIKFILNNENIKLLDDINRDEVKSLYPSENEREALNLLIDNDNKRNLNFKQIIKKLQQIEKLSHLSKEERKLKKHEEKMKDESVHLDEIEKLMLKFKENQDSAEDIQNNQLKSIMNQ